MEEENEIFENDDKCLKCPDCGLPLDAEIMDGYSDNVLAVSCDNGHQKSIQFIAGQMLLTGDDFEMEVW